MLSGNAQNADLQKSSSLRRGHPSKAEYTFPNKKALSIKVETTNSYLIYLKI
ncbi:MAG: hypothetical protein ACW97V_13825 [Promethearchaeota archaeon]